ncbi:MAG: hypothetical protein J0L72_08215 [Armatimonadetes bacterium]|nr:hypothetical protein [Armatimonadota bacterium]
MLGRLFGKKSHVVIATINARILPMTRGEFIEDPLDELLREAKLGKVQGAGTALSDAGDAVTHVDIEIRLKDSGEPVLNVLLEMLNDLCVPKGSFLTLPDGRKVPVGQAEGLEIKFETAELADAFAQRLMEGDDAPHHYGDFGTAGLSLNLYGPSFAEMETACRSKLQDEAVTITQIA